MLWWGFERITGYMFFDCIGVLEIGFLDGEVVFGVLEAVSWYDLSVEVFDRVEIQCCFLVCWVPEGMVGVYESDAGYLWVEDCVFV